MKPTCQYMALTALLLLLGALPAAAQVQPLTAWWIDTGDSDSAKVSGGCPVGDVNGDGLADFAGLTLNNYYNYTKSWISIYLGSLEPDTIPDITIYPPNDSLAFFGVRTINTGDVNGDGDEDFIAGASNSFTYFWRRQAYLYFGGAAFDTLPDVRFYGDSTGTWTTFAQEGSGLGDINGDGFNDFTLLDEGYIISNSPFIHGAIYIYYGGNPPDAIPDVVIYADSVLNRIGRFIAPLGDVNGDGYDDWVMSHGDCQGQQGEPLAGVVALYYGGNPPDTIPHLVIYGPAGSGMGRALTTLDWNGDGQLDLLAENYVFYAPNYHGSIWEFNVSPAMTGQPDHIFLGQPGDVFGWYINHVGLDGQGGQDVVDGEPGWSISGKVYVILNSNYSDTLFDATYYQGHFNSMLGGLICNAGDVNNDGLEDMVIDEAYSNGRLHMILGSDSLHQSGVIPLPQPAPPQDAALLRTYPNPFNHQVILEITAPGRKNNLIQIYNPTGQEVRRFPLGYNQTKIAWDGKNALGQECSAGVYLAKLTGPNYQATTKLTLIR
jgi:hypothetical protein